jgi:hypothetical protein
MDLISLEDYLKEAPNIEVATTSDNLEINTFLESIPMEADSVALKYDRTPDFFQFLKEQANFSYVIKMLNKDMSIGGIGVITVRYAWVDGIKACVAYTSDLRVSTTLWGRTRVQWRKYYEGIVKDAYKIKEFSQVKFFYTAIFDDNERARSALVNTKSAFSYQAICPYRSINIYARRLCLKNIKKSILPNHYSLHHQDNDQKELRRFLHVTNKEKQGGQYYDSPDKSEQDEYYRRKKVVHDYDYQKYLVVKDEDGNIISCCYPWSNNQSRKIVIEKMNTRYKIFTQVLPFIGGKKLKQGQGLKILYLIDLSFKEGISAHDKNLIICSYLQYLYKNGANKDYHIINMIDYYCPELTKKLKQHGYFFEPKEATLYQVLHNDHLGEQKHYKVLDKETLSLELAFS